jgi:hypothetical protein
MSKEKKEVTATLAEVLNSIPVVEAILNQRMPARLAFKVSLIRKSVAPLAEAFDEVRNKLVEETCKKDKDGNPVYVDDRRTQVDFADDESRDRFVKEIEETLRDEISLSVDRLTFDELDKMTDWKPTPIEIELISYLLDG